MKKEKGLSHTWESIFYAGFAIYLLGMTLSATMIVHNLNLLFLLPICKGCSLLLILTSWFFRLRIPSKLIVVLGSTLGVCSIVYLTVGNYNWLIILFIMFSAYNVSDIKIAKIFLIVVGGTLFIACLLSLFGIIENRIFYDGSVAAQSLGTIFPNTLASYSYNLLAVYTYLRRDKITAPYYIFVISVIAVSYYVTRTRLELVASLIMVFLLWCYKWIKTSRFMLKMFSWSFVICGVITVVLVLLYILSPQKMQFLDDMMSSRLSLGAIGIQDYGFSLFGKEIPMQGWATVNFDWAKGYFYIDAFFLNYTLQYGLVVMVLFITILTIQLQTVRKYDSWLMIFVLLSALHGMIIAGVVSPSASPFVMMVFIRYSRLKLDSKESIRLRVGSLLNIVGVKL